jgi:putative iron-regulated protein
VSEITPDLLKNTLQEAGGIKANVATGFHAIEFLLWGQDLNGTGPGAGDRPASDYDLKNCTVGHCDRRAAYLKTASTILVDDLKDIVAKFQPDGAAAKVLTDDPVKGITALLTGMGSLSYGELAGERMKLALLLHDTEEEPDCFSDNTAHDHRDDMVSILSAYTGTYERLDGTVLKGPSIQSLVQEKDKDLDVLMMTKLTATMAAMDKMVDRANTLEAYDQMIAEGNVDGNAVVQAAIDGLIDQTKTIERVVSALNLTDVNVAGSDSLDQPAAVSK